MEEGRKQRPTASDVAAQNKREQIGALEKLIFGKEDFLALEKAHKQIDQSICKILMFLLNRGG